MANQDESRDVSFSRTLSLNIASATGFKLPMLLTARPGNVGVQIDAHRTMNIFSHPRSVKFTSQFHGGMYENGSLENYSRVVERTAQRARLLQDKLDKLRNRKQYLLEDEAKRKQRRIQREAARQRLIWQMHQAAKRSDERARETAAAIVVQKVVREWKAYASRQQVAREQERRAREEDERRELEMHSAAAVLQRQARKHLKVVQEVRQQAALTAFAEDEEDENSDESEEAVPTSAIPPLSSELLADEKIITDALSRGISLDLLFSDEEDNESTLSTHSTSSIPAIEPMSTTPRILPRPPASNDTAVQRPRRPMSIKRVGGGYRTRLLPYPKAPKSDSTRQTSHLQATVTTSRQSSQTPLSPTATATTRRQKSDKEELRSPSPVKATISPYAIPQRLH
ncbi:Hypothetical protein PHPALM_1329 [Phytophthora palmivora]|uniref:Uncharacterized protein n=1 Tax=Phytophthora palmivora TaxID=4796 RepID=A0A2P4YSL3_9STRA|nr:Hypothetical protein PHPALM_1329 [Phytophthora palmivora]